MKIAVLTIAFPELSETFVSREVYALAARGHEVTVYTMRDPVGPPATPSTVPVRRWPKAEEPIDADVLYGSLGFPAHVRTAEIARRQHLKYLLKVWEGFDAFTAPNPDFYRGVVIDPHSMGVIVEDGFMQKYAREKMALPSTHVIPNGIDTTVFVPGPPRTDESPVILAVARFVAKKGLIHLVNAFKALNHPTAILRLVGYGPLERELREAAAKVERIEFLPPVGNEELPAVYQAADIFAAPCVTTRSGDSDGIPTTVLEAMSCGLAVVVSELLSSRCYIEHNTTGVLIQPGHEGELTQALATLLAYPDHRRELGAAARRWAVQHVDLAHTVDQLEALLQSGTRQGRWVSSVRTMADRRASYQPIRLERYDRLATECMEFFQIRGDVLDVGCGDGHMQRRMNGEVTSYVGVDAVEPPECAWKRCFVANAESLPFEAEQFDTVLSYSVLQQVLNPSQVLAEAWRVLRPGGRLALQCSVADANPLFLFWWEAEDVVALVEQAGFRVEAFRKITDRLLVVNASKGGER